jgi:large subunit ribosomal protein L14
MVQVETLFSIIDNSGVRKVKCIKVLGRKVARPGDMVVVSVKRVSPNKKITKGAIFYAVLVNTSKPFYRSTGFFLKSLGNHGVLLKSSIDASPYANRVSGVVYNEVRLNGFSKIASLTSDLI